MQRSGQVYQRSNQEDQIGFAVNRKLFSVNQNRWAIFPVLDGELAVPCNPESAIPGSNPHLRFSRLLVGGWVCDVEDQVLRNSSSPNPARTGR